MPWTRPTLEQLRARRAADYSGRLLDGGPLLSRSVLNVLATVDAGAEHEMLGYLSWMFLQVFPDTAESDNLERWARIWSLTRKAGAAAAGAALFRGTAGAVVPAGTVARNADGGLYRVTRDAGVAADGTAAASIQAAEPGEAGNLEAGAAVQLVSPVPGVVLQGEAGPDGVDGGTDAESDDNLRVRLLAKIQRPPHGGNADDYVQWALAVPGVTRAWCYPFWLGLGTVGLTFVNDNDPDSPIPPAETVRRVQDALQEQKPVTAALTVFAPEVLPVNVSVTVTPYSEALAAQIRLELKDLFDREAEPGGVIPLSHIHEAISIAPGEYDHALHSPASDITPAPHQLPVLGTVSVYAAESA